ncbi:hypothetical protein H0E84_19220 [Luteimonas sp. SJ-92]|uniref:Beta-ketoacyl synthase N-terminal domain-containing protein n=1 Tax=Luteimonas salinisoli TaxID=2752307 RepID=A0A853JIV8_9GAMM|nr:hypothetical protein [Luteimonas salinisoli]NZA28509.1 hypothetical protein [Luteimonas salinisoli]
MKLSGFWRTGLVVVAVFAAVWLCAILYWRASGATPGGGQMLLWLAAVPLGLLAGFWAVGRLRAARRRAPAAEAPAAPAEALESDAERFHRPLDCLAGAVRLPCGETPEAVLAALPDAPRPGLHPRLRDRDGMPVFAAFVADLDTDAAADALPQALRPDPEQLRALALLEPVALELFDALAALLPPLPVAEQRVIAGLRRSEREDVREAVQVRALLPASWPAALRQACDGRLRQLALDAGLDPRRVGFEAMPMQGAADVWRLLDRLGTAEPDGAPWQLLLACDSAVGERSVAALADAGRLMDGRRREGLVPGEGAAGVLLRPPGPATAQVSEAAVALHRVRLCAVDPDASARVAARASAALLERALRASSLEPDAVALLLSDADQRAGCAVEAGSAAAAACPELDVAVQAPALGGSCGHLGHVAPLALLALAAAQVRSTGQPALALAVTAGRERAAVAFAPPDAPSSDHVSSPEVSGQAPDLAA